MGSHRGRGRAADSCEADADASGRVAPVVQCQHGRASWRILSGPFPDLVSREVGYNTAWAVVICVVCWKKRAVYIKTREAQWSKSIVDTIIAPLSTTEWGSYQQQKEKTA